MTTQYDASYQPVGDGQGMGLSAGDYTWAGKPPANSVPVGTVITIQDFCYSDWYSDGSYWRPKGGQCRLHAADLGGIAVTQTSLGVVAGTASPLLPISELMIPNSYFEGSLFYSVTSGNTNAKRLQVSLTNGGSESYVAITTSPVVLARGRIWGRLAYRFTNSYQASFAGENPNSGANFDRTYAAPASDSFSVFAQAGGSGETFSLETIEIIYHA